MIYLHKILPFFLSPLFFVLVLLVLGLLTRRRAVICVGVIFLWLVSTPLVADALFKSVEKWVELRSPEELPTADAIVVLSAGMQWIQTKNGHVAQWATASRFLGGVALFKTAKAPLLVFTGGKLPWQGGDETEGDVLSRHAMMMQVPATHIQVTEKVENTQQEARAVRKLLAPDRQRIILVTSGFHMQRAQLLFEAVGFEVIPYSVDIRTSNEDIRIESFLPHPSALSTTHTAMRELLGRLYYQVNR